MNKLSRFNLDRKNLTLNIKHMNIEKNIFEQVNQNYIWEDYSGPENERKTHIIGFEQQFLPNENEQIENIKKNQDLVKKFLNKLYSIDSTSKILSENLSEVKLDGFLRKRLGTFGDKKIQTDYTLSQSEPKKFIYIWLHELGHALTAADIASKREQAKGNENLGKELFGIPEHAADLAVIEMVGVNNFFEIADFILKNKESLKEFGDYSKIISRLEYIKKNYVEWKKSINKIWILPFTLGYRDKNEMWDIYMDVANSKTESEEN